jgi:hypothetical protein
VNNNRDSLAAQQAAGLRALADMIERNPNLASHTKYTFVQIDTFADTQSEIRDFVRAGLAHGAEVTKDAKGDVWFTAKLAWGPVVLHVNARREQVCERVVLGTREVTEEVPDPEALAAVPKVTVTKTVEDVDWVCRPLLAADEQKASA